MPLFFFLSGLFVDSFLNKNLRDGIKSKALRLMIPYFIWTFIFVLIKQLTRSFQFNESGWMTFIRSPFDPNPLQYWFLYVLFVIYLIYGIIYLLFKDKKRVIITIFIVSIVLALIEPLINNIWISSYLFRNLIFFSLGSVFLTIYWSHKQ